MKYIRTKDRIEKLDVDREHLAEYMNVKQADTIEELCDKFVIFNSNNFCVGIIDDYETAKYKSPYKATVYGAIWTDKGLIYVAKMNDKGVLEYVLCKETSRPL